MMLLSAFLIGLFAGLRSLTPPAAVAWAVHLDWLKLARPLSLIGSLPAVIILSVLAITELIFDKLPNTPNRTAPPGLIARIVTGASRAHAFLLAVDSRLGLVLGSDCSAESWVVSPGFRPALGS